MKVQHSPVPTNRNLYEPTELPLFAAARDRQVRALPPAARSFVDRFGVAPETAVLFAEAFTGGRDRG